MTDYDALCERLEQYYGSATDEGQAAAAIRELRAERNQCICALAQVSFYARINHGTKCKDYGEVVDGILGKLGIPLGQLMTASEIDAALAGEELERAGRKP